MLLAEEFRVFVEQAARNLGQPPERFVVSVASAHGLPVHYTVLTNLYGIDVPYPQADKAFWATHAVRHLIAAEAYGETRTASTYSLPYRLSEPKAPVRSGHHDRIESLTVLGTLLETFGIRVPEIDAGGEWMRLQFPNNGAVVRLEAAGPFQNASWLVAKLESAGEYRQLTAGDQSGPAGMVALGKVEAVVKAYLTDRKTYVAASLLPENVAFQSYYGIMRDLGAYQGIGVEARTPANTSPDVLADLDMWCNLLEQHGIRVEDVDPTGGHVVMRFPSGHLVRVVAMEHASDRQGEAVLLTELMEAPVPGTEAPTLDLDAMAEWMRDRLLQEGVAVTTHDIRRVLDLETEYMEQVGLAGKGPDGGEDA